MKKFNYERNDYKNEVKEYKSFDISEIKDDTILSIFDDKATLLKYLKSLETSVNNYQQQLNSLQDQVNNNTTNINNQTQDIININGNISSINGNINSINNDITTINTDIDTINTDITNLDTKSDNLIPMQLWSNDANFNPNNLAPYNRYEWTKLEEGRFIKATTNDNKISNLETETLTNIKGHIGSINMRGSDNTNFSGAFKKSTKSTNAAIGCGTPYRQVINAVDFDASKYNSVYKNNAHVQPNCINLVCWLRGNLRSN